MPQISVIVPVYQVESFIHRCVDSILNQTYTDFELILVDDGSPDNCDVICDEYAEKDGRIHVIHQKNRGLSSARNVGIDWAFANSDSEWLTFIDSDDWVHERYLELLYSAVKKYDVCVSQCGLVRTKEWMPFLDVESKILLVSPEEQYVNWFNAYFCAKLYKKTCFDHLRFPEGILFEDVTIWYRFLFSFDQIAIVDEPLYYYFQNPIGITNSTWTPIKLTQVNAWEEQVEFFTQYGNGPVLVQALRKCFWVLENHCAQLKNSDRITQYEKVHFDAVLRRKMRILLKEHNNTLRKMSEYNHYHDIAYPIRTKISKLLRKIVHKLKNSCWQMIKAFMLLVVKPSIVFESKPDFSDNTKPVFDEMVRRGFGKKYRFVWFIDRDRCASIKNGVVEYWNPEQRKTIRAAARHYSYYYKTKCIICCNRFMPVLICLQRANGKRCTCFYLSHGIPMKSLKGYYSVPKEIDYMISPSKAMNGLMAYEFSMDINKVFTTGFPRNDAFAKPPIDLEEKLGVHYERIIIWYPTYRQHKNGLIDTKGNALPIIHDEEKARQLNETAKQSGVLIIIKPHFAQDTSLIRDLKLSNIMFIDDSFFQTIGLTSYEVLASSDALLTDYSSVYFDYTLADKPIGVVWEDIEKYREYPGFAVNLSYYLQGAEKIFTIEDLCSFVDNVAKGSDVFQMERREIRDVVNISNDGNNTNRVVDFIGDKANLLLPAGYKYRSSFVTSAED